MTEETKRMYSFAHIWKASLYRDEELADGVKQQLDKLQQFHDRALARITLVNKNPGLTGRGKRDEFARLKDDLTKELQAWFTFEKGYAEQIERIEANMNPTRHPKDDAVWELRQREIRDYLRTLDPTEVEALVRKAAENGDDELLQAVTYSPIPFQLATAGLIDEISHQRWEREFPDDAAKLADLRHAAGEALSALRSVQRDLHTHGLEIAAEASSIDQAAA